MPVLAEMFEVVDKWNDEMKGVAYVNVYLPKKASCEAFAMAIFNDIESHLKV